MIKSLKIKLDKKLVKNFSLNKIPKGEEKFRALFENAKAGIFLMSLRGDILELNKSFARMHGYTVGEMKKMNLKNLETLETSRFKSKRMKRVLLGREMNFEVEHFCKNGKVIPLEVSTNIVKIGGQKYILAFHHDISERRKIENALKENERKYKELFNDANDAIWLLDGNIFTESNKEAMRLFNCKNFKEIVGHSPLDFSPKMQPDGQESKKKAYKFIKLALAGHPQRFYWQHRTLKGRLIDAEISLNRINLKGKIYVQAIARDITERLKVEKKLKESDYLVENANSILLRWKKNEKISFINNFGSKIFGYKKGELIGKNVGIFVPKIESTGRNLASLIKSITSDPEEYFSNENENIKKDGSRFWVSWNNRAIRDENGDLKEILAVGVDVSKKKEIEKKLQESEYFFKESQKSALVGSYSADFVKDFWESSEILDKIFGIKKNYKRNISNWLGLVYKEDRKMMDKYLKDTIFKKHQFFNKEYRIKRKSDGQTRWVLGLGKISIDVNGKVVSMTGTIQDITKRKEIEKELKINEEKYRRLFEASKDSVLILNAENGKIVDSNPFIQISLGYSPSELIGKKIYEISPFKNIVENRKKFLELQKKEYVYYDNLPLQSKSGEIKNVEFVSNVYMVGTEKVIQCNIRDITERIKKEKKLEQAKNDFLSLASHQFRTPLSATKWVLESLEYNENLTLKQKDKLNSLITLNERLINLVNDMLDVTKIESGKLPVNKVIVDFRVLINDLLVILEPLLNKYKKNIRIILPSNFKNVYCDPVLISEVLKNLLSNAIIYSLEDSKNITLEVINRTKDYLISVHNDGFINKISLEDIKKFNKFTRGQGASDRQPEGSGLGLYITNNILKASDESFWCESNIKSGTSFYLTIAKNY